MPKQGVIMFDLVTHLLGRTCDLRLQIRQTSTYPWRWLYDSQMNLSPSGWRCFAWVQTRQANTPVGGCTRGRELKIDDGKLLVNPHECCIVNIHTKFLRRLSLSIYIHIDIYSGNCIIMIFSNVYTLCHIKCCRFCNCTGRCCGWRSQRWHAHD